MFSQNVTAGSPATAQQYNRLRDDARGGAILSPHESPTPNMSVVIESGHFYDNSGNLVTFAGGTANISVVGANPRYDLISIATGGAIVTTQGTASATPIKPTLPTGNIPVCFVYLRVGGSLIKTEDDGTNHYIIDARMVIAQQGVGDIQTLLDAKLDKVAGLRTGFGVGKTVIVDPATGNEVIKNSTASSTISGTDVVKIFDTNGDEKRVAWQNLKTDSVASISPTMNMIAGETLALNDIVAMEKNPLYALLSVNGITPTDTTIGNASANTRVALRVIGNGVSMASMNLAIRKVVGPVDNFTVRIETDNAGLPSGTLANANATASISGSTLTTSYQDLTVTFAGAFTLTANTIYHIVIARSGALDATNYYQIQGYTSYHRFYQISLYNGTSYGSYSGTTTIYYNATGFVSEVAVKSYASLINGINFIGSAQNTATIGQSVTIQPNGYITSSGLVTGNTYYLTDAGGTISTTAGTQIVPVGIAQSTTRLLLVNFPKLAGVFSKTSFTSSGIQTIVGAIKETIVGKPYAVSITVNGSTMGSNTIALQVSNDGVNNWTNVVSLTSPYNASDSIQWTGVLPGRFYRFYSVSGNSSTGSAYIA